MIIDVGIDFLMFHLEGNKRDFPKKQKETTCQISEKDKNHL
jgi:hypothetical protein